MTDTIVLGLDGANWGVIHEWLEEGRLPNLQSLIENGTHAISRSELPPVTCPNWKCYSTGKDPGGFGVFWWETIDFDGQEITFPDEVSFNSAELWDYFGEEGISWATVNMPTTYPPRQIPNGDIIAGGPLCADTGYTSDPETEEIIVEQFSYSIFPSSTLNHKDSSGQEVDETLEAIESRFDVAEWYLEKHNPEVFHLTIFLLNYIQHFFWDGTPLRRAWELIDERLDYLVKNSRNIILMSDHGSNEIQTVFYINNWLEREGYLQTNNTISGPLGRIGLTQENISKLVEFFGMKEFARQLPDTVRHIFPQNEGAKRSAKARMVNWSESAALASGQGPIYLNSDCSREEVKDLRNQLDQLSTPEGNPVASRVLSTEEAYSEEYSHVAPDLIIEQAPGIHITDGIGNSSIFTSPSRWRAENNREGIFLAAGPDIKDSEIGQISILDIAPTLLHLHGMAVPDDMNGDVLDIFSAESGIDPADQDGREPISISKGSKRRASNAEELLSDLGYLEQ
jgi:predicted AlkP superfamily phosphohydrolase/phosphomutase